MRSTIFIFTFLLVFNLVFSVGAEDLNRQKDFIFEEIVITESKIPQKQDEITHKIDVLTRDEILDTPLPNRNLSEAFKYLPGNFVNPLSRNDANWGSYGGLGPKYNSYLLDGLPIDSFVDPMSLEPIYIEKGQKYIGVLNRFFILTT